MRAAIAILFGKKRGRPATGEDPLVGARMPLSMIEAIDAWAAKHDASRSESIRRLIEASLKVKKPVGRPPTGIGTQIGMRWQEAGLAAIDEWRRQQPNLPSRTEAIRRLVEMGLRAKGKR